eukprot:scaffold25923_cov105-Isochrysis_galbana.AAC.5
MAWVAVREPFFRKSLTCASAMKRPSAGRWTAGVPPDTGPSFRTHAAAGPELETGSTGAPSPVATFRERTSRGCSEYSAYTTPPSTNGDQFFSLGRRSRSWSSCGSQPASSRDEARLMPSLTAPQPGTGAATPGGGHAVLGRADAAPGRGRGGMAPARAS